MCEATTMLTKKKSLHVARVAEAAVAGLGGALVEAHLQVQLALVRAQLLLGEGPLVLVRHLGAQRGAGVFRVFLGLKMRKFVRICFIHEFVCKKCLSRIKMLCFIFHQ